MNFTTSVEKIIDMHNEKLPFSGAIFVQNENEVFEQGYGYANRSERIKNTPSTRFGIASGCKIFTSVAICQLVQNGLLSLDTYLKDCLDIPFPHVDPEITIHHLLTHSSGIPDYFDEEFMHDFEDLWRELPTYSLQSPKDFLPLFQNEKMKFKIGERFSYNNAGFIVLGLVVEQVTGMRFTDYVEKHIFEPSGMTDSGYFRMDQLPERTALGYIDGEHAWRSNIFAVPIIGGPDGGAFTTVRDFVRFWEALLHHELLSAEYTDLLLTPHVKVNENTSYGYGVWIRMQDNNVFKYFVMGSDPGVTMQSSIYSNGKAQAHILGNINQGAGMIAGKIDELFL
ncbi:serine hydrolase domain-containing protein [Paenibacillus sp. DYY-L-2]|uniref:serine hydrolase domain-containing protein n=1 Tax=Paenibacillus sp. DYY-L-2 TaxID=3447013 RepID=UPI003F4FDFE1